MLCPYCEAVIAPTAKECPECRLTYSKACHLFGAPPRMGYEVHDSTHTLTATETSSLRRKIHQLNDKYPDLAIRVIFHHFPQPHPLRTYAFWIFNAGQLSIAEERGSTNHTIAWLIDPSRGECAMIPGYGLEPHVSETVMSGLLDEAIPFFQSGEWHQGIQVLLQELDLHLETFATPVGLAKSTGDY